MPTKFKDIGKGAKDLLNKKYKKGGQEISFKTTSGNGVEITATSTQGDAKSALGKLAAKFSPMSNVSIKSLSIDANKNVGLEGEMTGVMDGVTFGCKVADTPSGDNTGDLTISAAVAGLQVDVKVDAVNTGCDVSAVGGYENFELGGSASLSTGDGGAGLSNYGAALAYNTGDMNIAVKSTDKFASFNISALSSINSSTTVAAAFNTSNYGLTTGCSYMVDGDTTLQGKINTDALFSFNIIQKFNNNVTMTVSSGINTKDFAGNSHTLGWKFAME